MTQIEGNRLQLANTLDTAAASESKRMLEDERKLVQRLQIEIDYGAQKAERKVEEIGQQLADARKDIENATTRVHIAENAWIKAKRELQEEQQLVQLKKWECTGTGQSAMIRVEEKELELANALNAAAIAERMLDEERKLVQRLKLEKDEEAQMAKRKVDEIGRQLAEAQRDIEYATTRADVAENEWMKAKRELQEEREFQLLKRECEATRQSAMRQFEEKEPELANALNAAAIAESECSKLKRMLEEERNLTQRLKLEKDDEAQLAKRKMEEIGQQLGDAQSDVEYANTRADVAENEWIKAKRELQEKGELIELLKLECEEARQSAQKQVEEKGLELANALNASAIAESECAKLKRALEEVRKLAERLKLEKDDEAQMAKRKVEEISQQLADARKDVEFATTRADVAENEWIKAERELEAKQELIELLKLECEETRQSVTRQVEEKEQELADALAAAAAEVLAEMVERKVEEISQQLADARNDFEFARTRADVAENEWIKAKRESEAKQELIELLKLECEETRESVTKHVEEKEQELADALDAAAAEAERELEAKQELIELLKLECEEARQSVARQVEEKEQELADAFDAAAIEMAQMAERKVEEISQQLADARNDFEFARTRADIAENEWIKAERELEAKQELIELLKLECEETRQSVTRQVEENGQELADALDAAAAAAESRSAATEACSICLAHEKDMAFGCGHMTCGDCGLMLTMCPICREQITSRLSLFPG